VSWAVEKLRKSSGSETLPCFSSVHVEVNVDVDVLEVNWRGSSTVGISLLHIVVHRSRFLAADAYGSIVVQCFFVEAFLR